MPSDQEKNQFRRLIGDYNVGDMSDLEVTRWLDDAANELTVDFATPYFSFDGLTYTYHSETILKAAINWWWNRLSELQEKHTLSVGDAKVNVGERWNRAYQMLQTLTTNYDDIRTMGFDIHTDNYSRWSKQTLRRIGGIKEENT